ncbi:MAG TPA: glycoside hydrolase family 43 protein [Opitutaceae bacterium]|nr:glycoside hydrolase family 43 protein [Opitutaceae bacterium]
MPFLSARASRSILGALALGSCAFMAPSLAMASGTIDSGSLWLDTSGHPINAHGGGFLRFDGRYYWYGEIKTGETTLPEVNASWGGTRVPFTGVGCYSSTDLSTWKFEGNVLPANPQIAELDPARVVERPKVIFNRSTREFVMWMHIDSPDYLEARLGVAVADKPQGPFRYVGASRPNAGAYPEDMSEDLRQTFDAALKARAIESWTAKHPEWKTWARDFNIGQMARDMALFLDDDGAAYVFYASEENEVMHVSRLSDDYLQHTGHYRRITFDKREAPAPFKWKGRYYLATSGCTGWDPNPTMIHSAGTPLGPWENHGSFFDDNSSAAGVSYLSQPCFVLQVEGGGLLFMADRWNKFDLEASRYVWLPIETSSGVPRVRWLQRWSLDRF